MQLDLVHPKLSTEIDDGISAVKIGNQEELGLLTQVLDDRCGSLGFKVFLVITQPERKTQLLKSSANEHSGLSVVQHACHMNQIGRRSHGGYSIMAEGNGNGGLAHETTDKTDVWFTVDNLDGRRRTS